MNRIVRERAFTVLNRLCALRMAEARGLLIESIARGHQSKGFQLYAHVAGPSIGETGDAYREYLFGLFDEFAIDLPVLFDRFSPQGRLFPREAVLLQVLDEINQPDIDSLWAEDETIGWIYQYFNSVDERRQMRAESAAPRNSRELAVRNQFFTPRYVVQFLTDNTLGRIWYEMTQGRTALKDTCRYLVRRPNEIFLKEGEEAPAQEESKRDLSQEELLKRAVYIPFRPIKDPRDIKMLDPACGSMHFGLYAFDLFERIYDEAWEMENRNGPDCFIRPENLKPLRVAYENRETFLRDVPRLIIEHNIHGIDIDPRAVQIAGMCLWLRAQKSWHGQGVKPQERPQIRRSNVVCAEPMPGEEDMRREFVNSLQPKVLGQLVDIVFDKMALAGEAGSLLKIEEEIRHAAAKAKGEYILFKKQQKKADSFLLKEFVPKVEVDLFDFADLTDEGFLDRAEEEILAALKAYSEQAENSEAFRRRLFAEDAARGFAFIDLCRKRYDVVLMNPPFGQRAKNSESYIRSGYQNNWKDIYACFLERTWTLVPESGRIGAITSSLFLYSKQLKELRRQLIFKPFLETLVELGSGVLDTATVDTALTVQGLHHNYEGLFLDLTGAKEKGDALLSSVLSSTFACLRFEVFAQLRNWPLCYHLRPEVLRLWHGGKTLEPEVADIVAGNITFDDERFVRLRYEVPPEMLGKKWWPYEKGGSFQLFLAPTLLVVNWENDGKEMRENQIMRYGTDAQVTQSISWWFKPGLSYPRISSIGFGPKVLPGGQIFSEKGMGIFPKMQANSLPLLGLLCSTWTEDLLNAFGRHRAYENNAVANLPYSRERFSSSLKDLSDVASKAVCLVLENELGSEVSPYFFQPRGLRETFPPSNQKNSWCFEDKWHKDMREALASICDKIDDIAGSVLFGENRPRPTSEKRSVLVHRIESLSDIDSASAVSDFVQYCLGCLYGRWDIRVLKMNRQYQDRQSFDLFDPLPVWPPGALQSADGYSATAADVTADYPMRITWSGVLVDDEGHPEDIVLRIREAEEVILGAGANDAEQNACETVGVPAIRSHFRDPNKFFADHLSRYSRSRRQAPIYWPLSTVSGSYSLWLYYHRLTDQTLYTCVNDNVDPKLKQVSEDVNRLRQKPGRSKAEEAELERLTDFEAELKGFREELLRIARFWKPNLNDGVQITAAPLWKLFRHKPWQKTLKETWEKLEAGDYDWSHLSYSIWPDRVREKCKTDKSLAIAHDFEELYEEPKGQGKKKGGRRGKKIEDIEDVADDD